MPGGGPGGVTRFRRLPGDALAKPADNESHRVDLRHHPLANGEDQELPEREDGAESRASVRHERREAMERLHGLHLLADMLADVKFIDAVVEGKMDRKADGFTTAIQQN